MLNSGTSVLERESRTCRLLVTKHHECCQVKVARQHLRMLFEQGKPNCGDSDVHDNVPKTSKCYRYRQLLLSKRPYLLAGILSEIELEKRSYNVGGGSRNALGRHRCSMKHRVCKVKVPEQGKRNGNDSGGRDNVPSMSKG
ncbi:hypothetical protein PR003_g26421 [Phytophthora rubi]|uniref:Uncharacterized protein n=2 Tax=Phytophthora rubi TaxID=129364 RepID=A0A6A3J4Q1_9STRA|nr:hypothetical protein PR001_g22342 [Phytophthora rubi]KAE9286047.1 hypothetical protein PR003_g26421 [Phytophthora rubi]